MDLAFMATILKMRDLFLFLKTVWSRHLFLFYFKRKNKIRKKNSKYGSLLKKAGMGKIECRSRGQVTFQEDTAASRSTPLSP